MTKRIRGKQRQSYKHNLLHNVLSLLVFPLPDSISINYKDSRWVGAWWLGFIVTGAVILLSSIPFWFLPKSLPKQGQKQSKSTELATVAEHENFLQEDNQDHEEKEKPVSFQELAKGTSRVLASAKNAIKQYDAFKDLSSYNP